MIHLVTQAKAGKACIRRQALQHILLPQMDAEDALEAVCGGDVCSCVCDAPSVP